MSINMLKKGLDELVPKLHACVSMAKHCDSIDIGVIKSLEESHAAALGAQAKINGKKKVPKS